MLAAAIIPDARTEPPSTRRLDTLPEPPKSGTLRRTQPPIASIADWLAKPIGGPGAIGA